MAEQSQVASQRFHAQLGWCGQALAAVLRRRLRAGLHAALTAIATALAVLVSGAPEAHAQQVPPESFMLPSHAAERYKTLRRFVREFGGPVSGGHNWVMPDLDDHKVLMSAGAEVRYWDSHAPVVVRDQNRAVITMKMHPIVHQYPGMFKYLEMEKRIHMRNDPDKGWQFDRIEVEAQDRYFDEVTNALVQMKILSQRDEGRVTQTWTLQRNNSVMPWSSSTVVQQGRIEMKGTADPQDILVAEFNVDGAKYNPVERKFSFDDLSDVFGGFSQGIQVRITPAQMFANSPLVVGSLGVQHWSSHVVFRTWSPRGYDDVRWATIANPEYGWGEWMRDHARSARQAVSFRPGRTDAFPDPPEHWTAYMLRNAGPGSQWYDDHDLNDKWRNTENPDVSGARGLIYAWKSRAQSRPNDLRNLVRRMTGW